MIREDESCIEEQTVGDDEDKEIAVLGTLASSGDRALFHVQVQSRRNGTPTTAVIYETWAGAKNVGGTVTLHSTSAPEIIASSSGLGAPAVGVSGTSVVLRFPHPAGAAPPWIMSDGPS